MNNHEETDIEAFQKVYEALAPLVNDARERVISSVATLLNINSSFSDPKLFMDSILPNIEATIASNYKDEKDFAEFAELFSASRPHSASDRALVAAYWLQVVGGGETFTGQSVNKELSNIGHKIANVTNALSTLRDAKPQQVLQLAKTGTSKQARKTYKLSRVGINRVKTMIAA